MVFGEVVEGMHIVKKIEGIETDGNDRPIKIQEVVVTNCGLVDTTSSCKSVELVQEQLAKYVQSHDATNSKEKKTKKDKKEKKEKKKKQKKEKSKKIMKDEKDTKHSLIDSSHSSKNEHSESGLSHEGQQKKAASRDPAPSTTRVGEDGVTYKGRGRLAYAAGNETGSNRGKNSYESHSSGRRDRDTRHQSEESRRHSDREYRHRSVNIHGGGRSTVDDERGGIEPHRRRDYSRSRSRSRDRKSYA